MLTNSANGNQKAERKQHGGHGNKRESVLQQTSDVFQQGQRPIPGLVTGAMQVIVIVRRFIKGQVNGPRTSHESGR